MIDLEGESRCSALCRGGELRATKPAQPYKSYSDYLQLISNCVAPRLVTRWNNPEITWKRRQLNEKPPLGARSTEYLGLRV